MANNCHNHIAISKISKYNASKLVKFLESYEKFNYMNQWVESFIPKKMHLTDGSVSFDNSYTYGAKWFDFEFEIESDGDDFDFIVISGHSAWSPMLPLTKILSEFLNCHISHDYEERGLNFAGEIEFDKGEKTVKFDGSIEEYLYHDQGISGVIDDTDWLAGETREDIIQHKEAWEKIVDEKDIAELNSHFDELLESAVEINEEETEVSTANEEIESEEDDGLPI